MPDSPDPLPAVTGNAAAHRYHVPGVPPLTVTRDRLADRRPERDGRSRRFHRREGRHDGSSVARATRHLAGWTPASTPTPRPLPAELAVGESNGRAPRVWRADGGAWRHTTGSGWTPVPTQGARPLSAARGGDALRCSPPASPALGGLISLGRNLPWGAPCPAPTWWARCGLGGCGWTPGPTSCGVAPGSGWTPAAPAPPWPSRAAWRQRHAAPERELRTKLAN